MSKSAKRIIFTGDFLRPSPYRMRPTQHHNIRWLYDIVSKQITRVTGLPCEIVAWRADGMAAGSLDDSTVATIYGLLGEPVVTIQSWARIYANNAELPKYLTAYFENLFSASIVIGFELSPLLKRILTLLEVPYVDTAIHPARFMDDLAISFHSSCPEVQAAFEGYRLDDSLVEDYAGLAAAASRRGRVDEIPENACLFVAQTAFDRSLIRNGNFRSIADLADVVVQTWDKFDHVLVKAHPLEPDAPTVAFALALSPKARLVETSVYALLASENMGRVTTLSSGVGIEASYFGKDTTYFRDRGAQPTSHEPYIGILHHFLHADFWRNVLLPLTETKPCSANSIPFKSNRLRLSLKSAWGFEE